MRGSRSNRDSRESGAIFSVGADNGGTWLRMVAIDARGKTLKTLRVPSDGLAQLPYQVKNVLRRWKACRPSHLVLGSKGVWTRKEKQRLTQKLKADSDFPAAFSDVELAHHAHFKGKSGILLIAGTGSMAYGRAEKKIARSGGMGAKSGDPGSGLWLGYRWLQVQSASGGSAGRRIAAKRYSPMQVAALAPHIMGKAENGEMLSYFVVQEAADYLSKLVWDVARKLDLKGPIVIGCHGGLFKSRYFFDELRRALPLYLRGRKIKAATVKADAALTAARMGRDGSWKIYLRADNPPR